MTDEIDPEALARELEEKEEGDPIESLPDRPLSSEEVESLNDSEDFEHVHAVASPGTEKPDDVTWKEWLGMGDSE